MKSIHIMYVESLTVSSLTRVDRDVLAECSRILPSRTHAIITRPDDNQLHALSSVPLITCAHAHSQIDKRMK